MTGSMTVSAQTESLKDIAGAKDDSGKWMYPQVRFDLTVLKDKQAREVFGLESLLAFVTAERDSLSDELIIYRAINPDRPFYKTYEFGVGVGVALTLGAAWAVKQAAN